MTDTDDLLKYVDNKDWEILTEAGWRDFKGVAKYAEKAIISVFLENNLTIDVSEMHGFIDGSDNVIYAKDSLGMLIKTKQGLSKVVDIKKSGYSEVYDIVDVTEGHTYLTNGIVSHNTHLIEEFWKSVFPIITSSKKSKVFICSTANGTGNLFHKLYDGAEKEENGWGYDKIMWNEVPGRDEKWATVTKQALGSNEAWLQEFNSIDYATLISIEGRQEIQIGELFDELDV